MGVVVKTGGPRASHQPHVIRKPAPAPAAEAVPEPIEPRPTARLDLSRLDGLIDTSRDQPVDADALEIAVEAAAAQTPSRGSSMRLAHTLRRDTPPAGLRPTTPLAVPIVDPHTRPTTPPPISSAKLAQGSVPDFPVYRPEAVPEAQDHQRATARIAAAEVVQATPSCVTSRMQQQAITSVDIPVEAEEEEDTSRPIDAMPATQEAAPVAYPTIRPTSGRVLGIVLLLLLLAGAGVTAAALFLY